MTAFVVIGNFMGVGTSSPWRTLSVAGTMAASGLNTGTGGNYLCIDPITGEILRGNGSACTASSMRFKDNVNDISYGLDAVLRLRPVSFTYKPEMNSGTSTHLGFIAEEVAGVIPELVSRNTNGEVQGLDYPTVTAVLTKAIQEQQITIKNIESRLASTSGIATASPSFISDVATAVKNLIAGTGEWAISKITSVAAVFNHADIGTANIGTASVENGLELKDSVTKQIFCVTIKNGDWNKVQGKCSSAEAGSDVPADTGTSTPPTTTATSTADTIAPVITINGSNPSNVDVGASYIDMGATVTDNIDKNLGIYAIVDGKDVGDQSNIHIDTASSTTHSIIYYSTDQAGNKGTAERTVNVVAATSTPTIIVPPPVDQTGTSTTEIATSTTTQ
jgi:hypothetical protein